MCVARSPRNSTPKKKTPRCCWSIWARASYRMGGSILGQVLNQSGDVVPDLDDAQDLMQVGQGHQHPARPRPGTAYHDRSDGGLLAAVAEMAFAGHVGVALNVDMLVTEGDGIAYDSRMDTGDSKNLNSKSAPPQEPDAPKPCSKNWAWCCSTHRKSATP